MKYGVRFLAMAALVLLVPAAPAYATLWRVSGSGVVGSSPVGVSGETIDFSFVYDDHDFGPGAPLIDCYGDADDCELGNPYGEFFLGYRYAAGTAIPVAVSGSISGAFAASPVTALDLFHEALFDSFSFVGAGPSSQVMPGGAFFYCRSAAACASHGFLEANPGAGNFIEVNRVIANVVNGTWPSDVSPWASQADFFTASFTTTGGSLRVPVAEFSWVSVPGPAPLWVFALGLIILVLTRHRAQLRR